MALIRSRDALVHEAIRVDNPNLTIVPDFTNCWVYDYQNEDDGRVSCYVHGKHGTGLRGRMRVKYNKYDVDVMTINVNKVIPKSAAMTTTGALHAINLLYGFALRFDEVIDHPIVNDVIILEPTERSLLWRGRTEFYQKEPPPTLASMITARDLDISGVDEFGMSIALVGSVLSMRHDYTAVKESLKPLAANVVLDTAAASALVTALRSVDGVSWGFVADSLWTLCGATVAYNGAAADVNMPEIADIFRPDFDRVLVLTPVANEQTRFAPTPIVFHYNEYSIVRS